MNSKETVLQGLVGSKVKEMKDKLNFWGQGIEINDGLEYVPPGSLTLEKFLELHPCPSDSKEITLYGLAWELMWSEKPPVVVEQAKVELIKKAHSGERLNKMERIWFKLIYIDTDSF